MKQRSGYRLLTKLSLALTSTCSLLFLIVVAPHLHSYFFLISGSSASAVAVQYSPADLAGFSDRIVPYKTRMGYFKYQKHLTDDRVIAIYQPHYVPGSDVRDSNPAMRGLRPGPREEYISDVYPIVLRISPKFPTGGMVSLIGVNFGKSGTACKVVFADVDAESCEVKSPDLAIIRLPSAAHYHISRVASMQPAFVEVKLHLDKRVGVSRIQIGSDAAADGGNAEYVRAEPSGPFADARRSTSQVTASVSIYITPPPPTKALIAPKTY
jgi:hypothetical protein